MTPSSTGRNLPSSAENSSFFASRLRIPALSQHYLRRPRLLRLLNEATTSPITVVVAPAGSGKTSLLVDWCSQSSMESTWLSLDETDRDEGQLWTAVAAALAGLVDGLTIRSRSSGSPAVAVRALAALLESDHPTAAVLIIDNVDFVDDEATMKSVALFLSALPEWMHVVLVSRRTPQLPIDRLRARGQLGEVHFSELRFSDEEAEEMLSRLTSSLAEEDVRVAVARAGGWAAGLQLTALAVRSERAQASSLELVSERDLLFADYVWREVLSAESPALVELLLDTCVVTRINPPLAGALSGRADAGELLQEAEARGLFVTRLGRTGWVEVHRVLRDELRAEVSRTAPDRLSRQHSRAARWFEDTGEVTSALEHWILASRPREALRVLARYTSELYDTGRAATIARTIAHIPLNVAMADFASMLEFAWCHLLVDRRQFLDIVHQASAREERLDEPDPALVARLRMLESIAATVTGDWTEGSHLATECLRMLGDGATSDPLGRFGWNLVARDVALSERWDDDAASIREVRLELSRDPERRLAFEGTRSLGEALAGRPVDALRIAAGVREATAIESMTILQTELGLAQAVAHRELGDRPRAVAELTALADAWVGPVTYAQALALLELTRLRLDEWDLESANETFERAHEFVRNECPGPGGRTWLAHTGTLLALATGDLDSAQRWSDQVVDPFWRGVGLAKVRLFEGRVADAAEALEGLSPRSPRHEVVYGLLRARAAPSHQESTDSAARAIELASSCGLVQTVASEGTEVLALLELHAWMAPEPWLDRVRRAASPHAAGGFTDPSHPGDHLTERELDVLRMLPSRLTLREIAAELFISVNTLKFHLRVIYRKLGVSSRADATEVARRRTSLGGHRDHRKPSGV